MKRVALYARVSTQNQEKEETINSQVAALVDYVKAQQDWVIPEQYVFKDEGYPGDFLARPALDALRDAAKARPFEAVLIFDPDRLARKYSLQELVVDELRDLEIEVLFLNRPKAETEEDKILQGFQGLFAEYERAKITERTRRGKLYKAKQGNLVGHTPKFGYEYVPKTKVANGYYLVKEGEARVVKTIFDWVANGGVSMRGVIKRLHEKGVRPSKGGEKWATSTLSRLIRDETYFGRTYYNKTYSLAPRNPRETNGYKRQKKSSRKYKPREEWVPIEVPAIVDKETFLRAQAQIDKNIFFSPRNSKHQYLLSGLLFCECSSRYTGGTDRGLAYYRCTNRIRRFPLPRDCFVGSVRANKVDPVVWKSVCDLMSKPELVEEQVKKIQAKMRNHQPTAGEEAQVIEERLKGLASEEQRLIKAYEKKVINLESLGGRLKELGAEKSLLEEQRANLPTREVNIRPLDVTSKIIKRSCAAYVTQRLEEFTFEEKQKFLRLLLDKITISGKRLAISGVIPLTTNPSVKHQLASSNHDCGSAR